MNSYSYTTYPPPLPIPSQPTPEPTNNVHNPHSNSTPCTRAHSTNSLLMAVTLSSFTG